MGFSRGFTLIELMVPVAIIGILAGVAIPHFANTRALINHGFARADLDTIFRAQRDLVERDLDGDGIANYASSLDELSGYGGVGEPLSTGESNGYRFVVRSRDPLAGWTAHAEPIEPCVTGTTAMTIDETRTLTEEPADGPACDHDAIAKEAGHAMQRLGHLSKADVIAALEQLRKDNPNLVGIVLAGMDRNQDGFVTIDEVLKGDYLALGKSIKGKLVFPKEWDAGPAGKDEPAVRIIDKFVEKLAKYLDIGIGNEGIPPPVYPPQNPIPAPN